MLLSDSPMKDHPLTPMRDANLVRVLQRQTGLSVGLIDYPTVEAGNDAIEGAFERAGLEGRRIVIVDAITDVHLRSIGAAAKDLRLVTGGSGIAIGLPANFDPSPLANAVDLSMPEGPSAILSGSCSSSTRRQIASAVAGGVPAIKVDPIAIADG